MILLLLAVLNLAPPLRDTCNALQKLPADEAKLARILGAERSRKAEQVKAPHDHTRMDTKTTLVFDKGDAVIYQWPGGAPHLVELRIRRRIDKPELPVKVGDRADDARAKLGGDRKVYDCDPEMGPSIKLQVVGGRVRVIEWSNWPD
jgi:hypothetical protein